MKQNIYSLMVVVIALMAVYLYVIIFTSSLRFENNKALFYADNFKKDSPHGILLKPHESNESYFFNVFVRNPLEVELYLRSQFFDSNYDDVNHSELKKMYQSLLQYRPTWPYYHTGLSQVEQLYKRVDMISLNNSIKFGPYERKVAKSVSEILFYNWLKIENKSKDLLLSYLIGHTDNIIELSIKISAKFAKVYDYCDYIFEKKHVEYRACKQEYWQPLIKP